MNPQTPSLPDANPRFGRLRSGGRKSKFLVVIVLLSPVLSIVGCRHIGPPTITEDRLAYNKAVSTSWKQQILLNIVRLRYHDLVDFVDISSVTQNHTLTGTTQATLGASLLPWNLVGNTLMPSLMGTRTTTDQPAITYAPQSGSEFIRNLNLPIKPYEIFNLIQGGSFRASNIMDLTVESINGIRNDLKGTNFKDVAKAIAVAYYDQGDISFPIEIQPDSDDKVFIIIPEQDSHKNQHAVATIREVLHLKAAVTKFEIVPGRHPNKENEIAVQTRSVIGAMASLSRYVPPRIDRSVPDDPLKVSSGSKKPGDTYAAIKYQGNWFWIDWNDGAHSWQSMVYLRTLLALADTGARPTAPVLTIPVSR